MEHPSKTLFLILARTGSKRLPGKNLAEVGGIPLIGRAVRAARLAARRLDCAARVVVSTDDENLAGVAREWGAETPFLRPAELATDAATSVDAMRHAVAWFADRGEAFSEIVLVQPTSPLRRAEDVVRAVRAFRERPDFSVTTVRAAVHASADGIAAGITFALDEDVLVPVALDAAANTRNLPLVELNGAVYVCSRTWLLENDRLCLPGRTRAVMMPAERSIDVDRPVDLEVARAMHAEAMPWRPGRCMVIAEAGVNHNGSVETAMRLIDAARQAGADAVKFQTFSADRLATRTAPKAAYQQRTSPRDESQYEMLRRLELSADDHRRLIDHCRNCGIVFLSSAFSEEDVDLLDALGVPALKFGSGEVTNHGLLAHAAATERPIILSTGCSWLEEVAEAVRVLRDGGCDELALLHCVSNYPADAADVNLRAMKTLAQAFGLPVGYSDHTLGIEVAAAAAAMGARIIEKHFTLSREMPGPDHKASLEPDELAGLVHAIRNVEAALGSGVKRPALSEADTRNAARRSLVAAADLPAGTVLAAEHVKAKRPGTGISPARMDVVIGRSLSRDLAADEQIRWSDLGAGEA